MGWITVSIHPHVIFPVRTTVSDLYLFFEKLTDGRTLKITLKDGISECVTPKSLEDVLVSDIVAGREHVLFLTTEGKIFSSGLSR